MIEVIEIVEIARDRDIDQGITLMRAFKRLTNWAGFKPQNHTLLHSLT